MKEIYDWNEWKDKNVFVILKNSRRYWGKVVAIEKEAPITWISMILKGLNKRVMFITSEILEIKEES